MDLTLLLARLLLAAVLIVAGGAKLADLPGSRRAAAGLGVPERLAPTVGILLPIAELAIGVALIRAATAWWGALGALALLAVFIVAIAFNLARGRTPDCHCFGQIHSAPAGPATIARNGGLAAIALFILITGWRDPGASAVAWLGDLAGIEIVLLVGGSLVVGLLGIIGWAVVNLMSQNGRLLTRLDALEAAIATGEALPSNTAAAKPGLAVGTPAPAFTLPDLEGTPTSLDTLSTPGVPLMLLFTDPGCGPCNQVLRQVNRWRDVPGNQLDFAVISRGSTEANRAKAREHNLDRILLQPDRDVSQAYGVQGTPAAVIVRPDGTIGSPLAGGIDAIQTLVASILEPKTPPAAPPAPSAQAPAFRLPNLDGEPVTLADLQAPGQPVMLFFTDPACDPCNALLPDVARWQHDYRDRLTLALVSRGTPEANRDKIGPHGIANVLLQTDLEVVNAYGLTQAPAVLVIRPDGTWEGPPAYGDLAVRQLVAKTAGAPDLRPSIAAGEPVVSPLGPLAVGEEVPSIALATLDGDRVDLADESPSERVLVFWNPGCGFCQRLVGDLKTWEAHRSPADPALVVISAGSAEATRAHGFASQVLLDDGIGTGRRFGAHGTPAAVRIDVEGRIDSPVASGATAVLGLLRAALVTGSNGHRPEEVRRDGLPA